jgi:DNA (cytosine-5)-methyltransferase 1
MTKKIYKYVDLFAGCGGLSIGLEKAGFELELAVEKSDMACETFFHNLVKPIESDSEWKNYCSLPLKEQAKKGLVVNTIRAVLDDSELMESLKNKGIDLVVGGPPCQGFSMAGRRNPEDARNQLPWQFIEFIERVEPKAILMENVVGITKKFTKHDVDSPFRQLYLQLMETGPGYEVQPVELNTMHFGIPQHRARVMLLGLRRDIARDLKMTFYSDIYKSAYDNSQSTDFPIRPEIVPCASFFGDDLVTASDAWWDIDESGYSHDIANSKYSERKQDYAKKLRTDISWVPKSVLKNKKSITKLPNHTIRNHNEVAVQRFRLYQYLKSNDIQPKLLSMFANKIISNDEKRMILKDHLLNANIPAYSPDGTLLAKDKQGLIDLILSLATKKHTQRAIDLDRPAPTMVTLPDDFVHPSSPRILSVREMARIQSFPDSFEFRGKETTGGTKRRVEVPQYTQVGNAVAPMIAYELGKNFMKILRKAKD